MQQAEIEWEHTPCPSCGHVKARPFHNGKDRLFGVKGEFCLVQCDGCSVIYLNPRPVPSSIGHLYPNRYSPYESADRKRPWRTLFQKKRMNAIDRIRRLKREDRLLDVGCGAGLFLAVVRDQRSVQTTGVELNRGVAAQCRTQQGLDVHAGTLLEQHFPGAAFDVVTMFHYFEHEGEPLSVLRETRRILQPDGLLVIEVPNAGGALAKLFKGYWFGMDVPRHLVNYAPQTLAATLRSGGFEIIEISFHPVAFFVMSLLIRLGVPNMLHSLPLRTALNMLLVVYLPMMPLELAAGWLLARLGKSDVLTVFAKPAASSRLPQRHVVVPDHLAR